MTIASYIWQLFLVLDSNMTSRLQEERKSLGFLADQVVEKINCSKSTYTRWEAGNPIPSDKLELLDKLGFDVLYIVTGKKTGQSIDEDSLTYCAQKVEEIVKDVGVEWPAKTKAKLIVALYETMVAGEELDDEKVVRLFKLAS